MTPRFFAVAKDSTFMSEVKLDIESPQEGWYEVKAIALDDDELLFTFSVCTPLDYTITTETLLGYLISLNLNNKDPLPCATTALVRTDTDMWYLTVADQDDLDGKHPISKLSSDVLRVILSPHTNVRHNPILYSDRFVFEAKDDPDTDQPEYVYTCFLPEPIRAIETIARMRLGLKTYDFEYSKLPGVVKDKYTLIPKSIGKFRYLATCDYKTIIVPTDKSILFSVYETLVMSDELGIPLESIRDIAREGEYATSVILDLINLVRSKQGN